MSLTPSDGESWTLVRGSGKLSTALDLTVAIPVCYVTCRRVIEEAPMDQQLLHPLGKNPRERCRRVVQAPSLHRVSNERGRGNWRGARERERRRLDDAKDGDTQTP
jgi:hypothetical protein